MFSSFIYFLESDFSVVGFIFDLFLTSFRGEKYFYVLSSGDMLGGLRVGREGFTGWETSLRLIRYFDLFFTNPRYNIKIYR